MAVKKLTHAFLREHLRSQLLTRTAPIGITIHKDQLTLPPSLFHDLLPQPGGFKRNALRLGKGTYT